MIYFYGVYPKNRGLLLFLTLLRFLAEPTAIRFSHITVRGPYRNKLPRARLEEIGRILGNPKVTLIGPDRFFSQNQNTVFLDVDVRELRPIWYKPDYPQGSGHITVYDGRSRAEAIQIFNAVAHYNWRMTVGVSDLRLIEPKINEDSGLLILMSDVYRAYDKFSQGDLPSLSEVPELPFRQRHDIFCTLLARSGLTAIGDATASTDAALAMLA